MDGWKNVDSGAVVKRPSGSLQPLSRWYRWLDSGYTVVRDASGAYLATNLDLPVP